MFFRLNVTIIVCIFLPVLGVDQPEFCETVREIVRRIGQQRIQRARRFRISVPGGFAAEMP